MLPKASGAGGKKGGGNIERKSAAKLQAVWRGHLARTFTDKLRWQSKSKLTFHDGPERCRFFVATLAHAKRREITERKDLRALGPPHIWLWNSWLKWLTKVWLRKGESFSCRLSSGI